MDRAIWLTGSVIMLAVTAALAEGPPNDVSPPIQPSVQRPLRETIEREHADQHWLKRGVPQTPRIPAAESDALPLVRGSQTPASQHDVSKTTPRRPQSLTGGTIVFALSIVVLLILGIAKVFYRKNPYSVPGLPRAAVDVLGRRTIEPRSTIYVVRVGGKILLLGSSPHGLNTLSEITDPIEVAALANQCRAVESPSKSLVGWLKTLAKRKSDRDPQPFADRLGQSLFQQAEQAGRTTTRVSVRGQREEDRHA